MFGSNRKILNEIDELEKRKIELARQVRDLSKENKELKTLRRQAVHNNTILVDENRELIQLLTEIADRAFCCPLDSEKIVLNKIKDLTRNYQTK